MKIIAYISLALFLLGQTLSQYTMLIAYELNKNEITNRFCINKNNLMKHCSGKCYLAKQLKKYAEEEERRNKKNEKTELLEVYNNISVFEVTTQLYSFEIKQEMIPDHIAYYFQVLTSIFHPPTTV
ncbi:hypothetical protein D3C72_877980 [compost metagenome]